jgi:ABC-type uncharacterized transport system substrate-binding protein
LAEIRVAAIAADVEGNRRRFNTRPGSKRWCASVVWALVLFVFASSSSVQTTKLIGVLSPFIDAQSTFLKDLRDGLSQLRLREGEEIRIEYRSAEGQIERPPELAAELVREIPVEQPTKFVFGFNSKTASALGIAVSPVVLMRADVVIE